MEKLKVGQRIELYQILTDGTYSKGMMVPGTIRPGTRMTHSNFVDIKPNPKKAYSLLEPLTMILDREVKPIGAMVIKKIHKH